MKTNKNIELYKVILNMLLDIILEHILVKIELFKMNYMVFVKVT